MGYPFIKTNNGLFNPITTVLDNTKSKLLNLFNTIPGQRVIANNCQFGVDLLKLLFQNSANPDQIKEQLSYAIKRWIPEVTVLSILTTKYQHSVEVVINFQVGAQISSINLEYSLNEQ